MTRQPVVLAFLVVMVWSVTTAWAAPLEVTLARDGKAVLSINVALPPPSPSADKKRPKQRRPLDQSVADLRRVLHQMTGAEFAFQGRVPEGQPKPGLYLGQPKDFHWIEVPKELGPEEFVLRSTSDSQVLLIGGGEVGMSNAIYAFLEKLGCRWYFPGATWEEVPKRLTVALALNDRQKPDISLQRKLAMGFGLHSPAIQRDYADWTRRNRMLGTLEVYNSHVWPGISPDKDFKTHPEWFALVKGERKPNKPCYSHPEVIARGVSHALAYFETNPGAQMVSVSAPDGADFCECELCRKRSNVEKIYAAHGPGGLFGITPDGKEVSVVSDTIFRYANDVADAVAKKYPGKYVGMIAYSAYSHPPSFDLRPNIYVEITKGYRRTPLTLPEQIGAFAKKALHLGIYEYYDVEQWSWDQPGKARASQLDYHAATIPYFFANKIHSIKGEISNNFGANGIGYFVLTRLMWDSTADVRAIEEEFYHKAFGPAAAPLKRFYRRWESGQEVNSRTLGLAYRDLEEAVKLTADQSAYRSRVDHIRIYLHFLKSSFFLRDFALLVWGDGLKRKNLDKLIKRHGEESLKHQVEHLGDYVHRVMDTNMVHSYAYNNYLKSVGKLLGCDTSKWQKPGTIPTALEIDKQFADDLNDLEMAALKDVEPRLFSRELVALKEARPNRTTVNDPKIVCEPFSKGTLYVRAKPGETISVSFAPSAGKEPIACHVTFLSDSTFEKNRTDLEGEPILSKKLEEGPLRFEAVKTGYYQIQWTAGRITAISHPAVLIGNKDTTFGGGTLYFFVPRGTRRFLMKTNVAGTLTFQPQAGRGKLIAFERKRPALAAAAEDIIVEVPEGGDDTVWSVSSLREKQGHAFITMVGVPNYLSLLPEQMLVPKDVGR